MTSDETSTFISQSVFGRWVSNMVDLESVKIMSNIFIAFIGSGVLGLPYAFKRSGILEGALVMATVAYFSAKAMLLLIDCQYRVRTVLENEFTEEGISDEEPFINGTANVNRHTQTISYSDVALTACGRVGRMVVESSLVCAQVGFCCGYLIFITENLVAYHPNVSKSQWLFILLPPLFLLTLIPDLRKLAIFSMLAQASNLFAFAVVFWFDFEHLHLANAAHRNEVALKGFPFFFCASVYCFEGAGMVISLEQSLPPSRRKYFKRYFVTTIVCITLLYISFGASGYLSFGPETKDIITLNLLATGSAVDLALLVKGFLCVSLFFSYPIMLFPVTSMLQRKHAALKPIANKNGNNSHQFIVSGVPAMLLRFALVSFSGFFVCIVPNFSDLMNIVGAVFGTILAFIMPALCHYAIFHKHISRRELALDCALVALGCLGCALGLLEAIHGDVEEAFSAVVDSVKNTNLTAFHS